jgi:hypothetical protein
MARKRKAEYKVDEGEFSQQAAKIRNPCLRQAHFHTVGETGIELETAITGRTLPTKASHCVTSTPLTEPTKAKRQTQVRCNFSSWT